MRTNERQRGRVGDRFRRRLRALLGDAEVLETIVANTNPVTTSTVAPARASASGVATPLSTAGNRFDVLCFPIIPWRFRYQRPQQILSRFAAGGHRVFYLETTFRQSGDAATFRAIRENTFEVSLRGPALDIYTSAMDESALDALFDGLDAFRRDHVAGATVSIVHLPFWAPLAMRARERFGWPVVYDCMDDHAGFAATGPHIHAQETGLLSSADLVVVSSSALEEKARARGQNVLMVRNACDFDHFAGRPAAQAARPIVGYYGAIAEWFDSDLVADVAVRRPDWDFVLVGHVMGADVTRLSALPNVRFAGEVPYLDLPMWLRAFDVTIVPFKRIPLTDATNPVKAYETLAAGKAVVSVPLPEVKAAFDGMVRLASTAEEFEQEIASELTSAATIAVRTRQAFAARETWAERMHVLGPAVCRTFHMMSVVVVTYDNLALTKLCMESLRDQLDWPHAEIIVVDNQSSDDTADYLRKLKAVTPHLKIHLNDRNRGFAAANNQALREATGHYIVLLNNDTIVPRGALSALARHLHQDPALGLVGPVTNGTGNEARVHVGYRDLADLPAWSQAWMHAHDGQLFDIPMLAMYCVAMRRDTLERVGLLDERFGVGMFEDDDYTRRVRNAGYRVACARDSYVHHWRRAAFAKMPDDDYERLFDRNRRAYEEKWGTAWTPHAYAPSTAFAD